MATLFSTRKSTPSSTAASSAASSAAPTQGLELAERTLLLKKECFVYRIPPQVEMMAVNTIHRLLNKTSINVNDIY